ncbi:3'(2'),5'-bisphosphate nucleotidase [Tepidiforma thermophila]|uniref:3'(2'),5'-bisphosphate nucleotidase n=1 Tax=Tepidiforma thermophila (strain KCTC 52669 / CGMCC 1.13589 / G233) TaxID=2761530 RepID=A0A2A9HFW4_TEPT2|nr:3'(2'),5'-bisphosphate nucleotidase [Tepidiforma thermophila]
MDGVYERELEAAREAALEAGAVIERLRRSGVRYGRKAGRELVSEADLEAAALLERRLLGAFPGDGWLSEEHRDSPARLRAARTWVVDPIDGTREFLQGIPEFAVSIALVVGSEPVLGVVHNPATGELFAAACCGAEERPPTEPTGQPFEALVGRGEHAWDDLPPLPEGTLVRPVGSVAYRLALLARGEGNATLTGFGRAEWDVAAGVALCRAAGLRVTGVLGDPLTFNQPRPVVRGLLAAEPGLHARLTRFFAQFVRE